MTLAEAIESIKAVGRHCRGSYRTMEAIQALHPSQRNPILETLTYAKAELQDHAELEALSPQMMIRALLEKGQNDLASRLDTAMRAYCGYDWNELIVAGPYDGESHVVECPMCGTKMTYTAPWFPDLDDDAPEGR